MSGPFRAGPGRFRAAAVGLFILGFTDAAGAQIPSQLDSERSVYRRVPGSPAAPVPVRVHEFLTRLACTATSRPAPISGFLHRSTRGGRQWAFRLSLRESTSTSMTPDPDHGAPPGLSHRCRCARLRCDLGARECSRSQVRQPSNGGRSLFVLARSPPIARPGQRVHAANRSPGPVWASGTCTSPSGRCSGARGCG